MLKKLAGTVPAFSWISGGKSKKDESNSNKYTLYLSAATSRCDTHTIPEREGDPPTVGYSPSQSGIQKRIESKSNPKSATRR